MNRRLFRNTATALAVVAALAAGPAQAYTPNKVNLGLDSFVDVTTQGRFSFGADLFKFTLPSVSDIVISLTSLPGSDITFSEVDLKHGGSDVFESGWMGDTGHSAYTFSLNDLAAGKYTLQVWGYTTSTGQSAEGDKGSYRVSLGIPAIPEPGEWAMLLAGLGVVGAIARRQNAKR